MRDGCADGLVGETLDRRGEHVGEGGGHATSEHDGHGRNRRADLDPEAGGEPIGAPAGAPASAGLGLPQKASGAA